MAAIQQMLLVGITSFVPATFDPTNTGTGITLSNGNKTVSSNANTTHGTRSTGSYSGSVKRYVEFTYTAPGNVGNFDEMNVGMSDSTYTGSNGVVGNYIHSACYQLNFGVVKVDNSGTNIGTTLTTGDILGMAIDINARTIAFYKNNVLITTSSAMGGSGSIFLGISPIATSSTAVTGTMNFGASAFTYSPPAGFTAGW